MMGPKSRMALMRRSHEFFICPPWHLHLCARQGGAQYLLAYPGRRSRHDGARPTLVGGHQQAGQRPLKRTGGLDGADESAGLGYDAVGVGEGGRFWAIT
jgi:hypothetical protein